MNGNPEDKRLFLLDAFALIFRAYFAFSKNPLINSKGLNTSAIQGFTNTLLDLLKKEKPSHIAVCFDTAAPTERHTDFADYKANRQEAPEDLVSNIPYIKDIIHAFNIPLIECDGFEADDVIGTLAKVAEQKGFKVYMVTPDKDYGQLVSENIFIWKPPAFGNAEQILGVNEIKAKWEIERIDQVKDILGLMGDAVDNIPGIPGVGEVTAKKLIKEFDSIENLIVNTDKLKGKLKEKVEEHKDKAILSKKLATIILDVPINWDEHNFDMEEPNREKLAEIFNDLEFRTLGKRILGEKFSVGHAEIIAASKTETVSSSSSKTEAGFKTESVSGGQKDLFGNSVGEANSEEEKIPTNLNTIADTEHNYILVDDEKKLNDLLQLLSSSKEFCFDTETTGIDANNAEVVGLSFAVKPKEAFYVPVSADKIEAQNLLEKFRSILEDENIGKVGQNLKYDLLLLKWYNIKVNGKLFDTMLAHYLIEPDMRHGMDYLSETYLNYKPVSIKELIGVGKKQLSMRDIEVQKVADYAAEDADVTLQLENIFLPKLKENEVEKLFEEVEMPLMNVLCDMEFEGVAIDKIFLNDYSKKLEEEIKITEEKVYKEAGVRFNLSSPKQLGEVLFDRMKIPYEVKKTKTGQYSTDEDTLSRITGDYPIVNDLLDYREFTKLKSTYVDAIPSLINPKTGRVHTSFNQAVAATGRLSSTDPNIQNIPIRTERGREIRKAFIPRNEDYVILSADYSQIELRIIAGLSRDANMLKAFEDGLDIHTATASQVFNVDIKDVTREMRGRAKAVNFGIAYGQTAFGLSQGLKISRTEAKEIIDNYNLKFPGVRQLMSDNIQFAREHGFVQTVLGRRRRLRDINSGNQTVRGFAERNAINAPIQGSAADMIKVAMINIQKEFHKQNFKSKMTLQVHDELVFDAHKSEVDIIIPIIKEKMIHAIELNVPIEVGVGVGTNWLDAH